METSLRDTYPNRLKVLSYIKDRIFTPADKKIYTQIQTIVDGMNTQSPLRQRLHGYYYCGQKYYGNTKNIGTCVPVHDEYIDMAEEVARMRDDLVEDRIRIDAFLTKALRECKCNADVYIIMPECVTELIKSAVTLNKKPTLTEEFGIEFRGYNETSIALIQQRLFKNLLE